jgi:hypothetical protein
MNSPDQNTTHSRRSSFDLRRDSSPSISPRSSSPYLSPNQLPEQSNNGTNANGPLKVDSGLLPPSLTRAAHLAPSPVAESPAREAAAIADESDRSVSLLGAPSHVATSGSADSYPYVAVALEPEIKEEPEESETDKAMTPAAGEESKPEEAATKSTTDAAAVEPSTTEDPSAPIVVPTSSSMATSPVAVSEPASASSVFPHVATPPPALGFNSQSKIPTVDPPVVPEVVTSSPKVGVVHVLNTDDAARRIQHAWRSRGAKKPAARPSIPRRLSQYPAVVIVGVPDDTLSDIGDYEHDIDSSEVDVKYVHVIPEEVVEKPDLVDDIRPVKPARPTPVRKLTNGVPKWMEDTLNDAPAVEPIFDSNPLTTSSPYVFLFSSTFECSYLFRAGSPLIRHVSMSEEPTSLSTPASPLIKLSPTAPTRIASPPLVAQSPETVTERMKPSSSDVIGGTSLFVESGSMDIGRTG